MTESEKSPVDPPRLGLFARMYSRAALKPLEFSIPLEQVLEEEFDQLHAGRRRKTSVVSRRTPP
jgi:hypothetical protein